MHSRSELVSLGWDDGWATSLAAHPGEAGHIPARVIAEHRDHYVIADGRVTRRAILAGRLRHRIASAEDLPAVGDWVLVATGDGAQPRADADADTTSALIQGVLPRRTAFRRKRAGEATEAQVVAANVDIALLLMALPDDVNVRRLERYLTLAWESGALPAVVLTKADLADDVASAIAIVRSAAPGVDVVAISLATGIGLDALERLLAPGRTAVLLGSSGVGKSTLANQLLGEERLRVGAVREDGKGRHTTTHRELFTLRSGALLIDTPGMRELQLWSADAGLSAAFDDVERLAAECRFRDCTHASEPGCAVRQAVESGVLAPEAGELARVAA